MCIIFNQVPVRSAENIWVRDHAARELPCDLSRDAIQLTSTEYLAGRASGLP